MSPCAHPDYTFGDHLYLGPPELDPAPTPFLEFGRTLPPAANRHAAQPGMARACTARHPGRPLAANGGGRNLPSHDPRSHS